MTTEQEDTRYAAGRVKQIDDAPDADEGTVTLLVSTDAMDKEGDVVEQSWTYDSQIPFLWVHNRHRDARYKLPLGHVRNPRVVDVRQLDVDVSEDATRGTVVDVDFDEDDAFASAVKRKYLRGDLADSSVGFDPEDMEQFGDDEPGRLHFLRSRLQEVSATPIGANQDTQLLKSFDPDVLPDPLKAQLNDGAATDGETPDAPVTKGGGADVGKEGRRNSKMDEAVQEHIKECAEYLKGDRPVEEIKPCPLHDKVEGEDDKMGDEDDKGLGLDAVAEKAADLLEARLQDGTDGAGTEKGGEGKGGEGGDGLPWSEEEFFKDDEDGATERKGQHVPDELANLFD